MAKECDQSQREFCGEKFDTLLTKIDNLVLLISGNGQPGINERLRTIEAAELERRGLIKRVRGLTWAVVTSVCVGLAAWIVELIKAGASK